MAGQDLWSDDEIRILRAFAPDYAALQKELKGRTFEAIRHKSNRLGLSKTVHIWTAAEVLKLRRLYPAAPRDEIIAAFPFATWAQIKHAARNNGSRREKPPYKKSRHPLMNAILEQCMEIGWSLADLDRECGIKRYFARRSWKEKKLNYDAVLKAIEILGGTISVNWDD